MRRIVVATDGSEGASRAVEYAAQRAAVEDAMLVIARAGETIVGKGRAHGSAARLLGNLYRKLVSIAPVPVTIVP